MVLRMAELGEDFDLLFTPAHNEPDDLFTHVRDVAQMIGKSVIEPPNQSLMFWIDKYQALPAFHARWCTRLIKIKPTIDYLQSLPERPIYCVGLRYDEDERPGLYGDYATYRYPLREWRWDLDDVLAYLDERGVHPPKRTNCKLCYDQSLPEWWELWKTDPDAWAEGERLEALHGHTLRSDGRDTWPASLKGLRERFEAGHLPRGADVQPDLFREDLYGRCRVCRL